MHALSNISDIESFYLRPNWTTTSPLKYYFFSFIHSPASTDLFLVSSAVQRLHLSEFEFYFKFASTFNPTGSYSSTESQNVNNHKSGKLKRTTTPLLLSSSRTATRLAADVVCLSYSPACLQLHQGLLLPRLMLYPLFSEFGGSSTNLLLVF